MLSITWLHMMATIASSRVYGTNGSTILDFLDGWNTLYTITTVSNLMLGNWTKTSKKGLFGVNILCPGGTRDKMCISHNTCI